MAERDWVGNARLNLLLVYMRSGVPGLADVQLQLFQSNVFIVLRLISTKADFNVVSGNTWEGPVEVWQ